MLNYQRSILTGFAGIFLILSGLWIVYPGDLDAKSMYTNRDDLFSIFFINSQNGWSCGRWGTILHTADGGKTWEGQESGTSYTLGGIYFTDQDNGWAVGNMGTIIHTSDGGKNWIQQNSPVPYYHMGVYFASPEKGWIVSEQTHILYTEDGGKTWDVQFQDEDYILKSISFSDARHGWAVGEFGHIYRTVDGGNVWEKLAGGAKINDIGDLEGGPFLYDVVAIDEKTVWVVGIEGRVMMTQNAGDIWKDVQTGAPPTQLFTIAFNKKDTLVISGKGVCLVSENLGQTWRKAVFDPPIDYTWIYSAGGIDSSHFVTCGEEGHIYVGDPGGFSNTR